jgi:hypothetical protein
MPPFTDFKDGSVTLCIYDVHAISSNGAPLVIAQRFAEGSTAAPIFVNNTKTAETISSETQRAKSYRQMPPLVLLLCHLADQQRRRGRHHNVDHNLKAIIRSLLSSQQYHTSRPSDHLAELWTNPRIRGHYFVTCQLWLLQKMPNTMGAIDFNPSEAQRIAAHAGLQTWS